MPDEGHSELIALREHREMRAAGAAGHSRVLDQRAELLCLAADGYVQHLRS